MSAPNAMSNIQTQKPIRGACAAFANAIINAEPNDDRMLRSWMLLPFVVEEVDYATEMRRAKALAYVAFQAALDVLRMHHVVQDHVKRFVNRWHAEWLEEAILTGTTPKELYGKARTSTATSPGHVLACIDLFYHAPMIPAPPESGFKWMHEPTQSLKSSVISYALHADIFGLCPRSYESKESAWPDRAGEYAGKSLATYGLLVGPKAYEMAAEALRNVSSG
jgi:hypothetical protein